MNDYFRKKSFSFKVVGALMIFFRGTWNFLPPPQIMNNLCLFQEEIQYYTFFKGILPGSRNYIFSVRYVSFRIKINFVERKYKCNCCTNTLNFE